MFDKKKLKKTNLLAATFFLNLCVVAQNNTGISGIEKPGIMRSEGKIYVVLAIVIAIVTGLLAYVSLLDKKMARMEKDDK